MELDRYYLCQNCFNLLPSNERSTFLEETEQNITLRKQTTRKETIAQQLLEAFRLFEKRPCLGKRQMVGGRLGHYQFLSKSFFSISLPKKC